MINATLQDRILKLICQSYAISYSDLEHLYYTINSFDVLFDIVHLSQLQNINLDTALELWKEHNIKRI